MRQSKNKKDHPHGRFWIKADACDITVVLQEFVKRKLDGGVDLEYKKLKELQAEYDPHKADPCMGSTIKPGCTDDPVSFDGREITQLSENIMEKKTDAEKI